ncbi:hypothetical protein B9T25_04435 [Acinetobacter sp. ANC 4470]|nr:hypothetical protein B9T25_04435 [Acinetobacter sp. ANC 4470]
MLSEHNVLLAAAKMGHVINADQLRGFKLLSFFSYSRRSLIFLSQMLGACLVLWFSPNEKLKIYFEFARKASCGAVRLTAKLVKSLLLIN